MNINKQLIEIASWRMVSEIFRCYPNMFDLVETHPGGGLYDCLSLYDKKNDEVMSFNRNGSLHYFKNCRTGEKQLFSDNEFWEKTVEYGDPKRIVTMVLEHIGLVWPPVRPISTPEILVYRYIAEFLTHSAFGRHEWRCVNGFHDTSGYSSGELNDFELFPSSAKIQRSMPEKFGNTAYNFWFIKKNGESLLCLAEDGTLMCRDGSIYSLPELYKKDRRIWYLIFHISEALLP